MNEEIINNLVSTLKGYSNLMNIGMDYEIEIPVTRMVVSDKEISNLKKLDVKSTHVRGYSCAAIDFLIGNSVETINNEERLKSFVEDIDLGEMNYYLFYIRHSNSFEKLIEKIHRDFIEG